MLEGYLETEAFSPFLSLKLNQTSDDPIIFAHTHPQLIPYKTCVCMVFFVK